jgi:hypothetical protein
MGPRTGLDLLQMKKITLPASIRTLGLPPHYLITILTELPRLQGNDVIQRVAVGTGRLARFCRPELGKCRECGWQAVQ